MQRQGRKLDCHSFSDVAAFKRDTTMTGRNARRVCKVLARWEKRSEKHKAREEIKDDVQALDI